MRPPTLPPLTPEESERVYDLFHAALEQPAARRDEFIDRACADQPAVRMAVKQLVACEQPNDDLLAEPAAVEAAKLIATALSDEPPLAPGAQLGRYRITRALGAGGMGRVYLAQDDIGKEVAIKTAKSALLAGDAEWLIRFDREARTQAKLNHPNIAAIYGREEANGYKFLVLEYVPGATLADRLHERRRLPAAEAVPIFLQLTDALEAMHSTGRVHRDLKPSNVMITPQGQVKLLDFGIAKRVAAPLAQTQPDGAPELAGSARSDLSSTFTTQVDWPTSHNGQTRAPARFDTAPESATPLHAATLTAQLTRLGQTPGTPLYMSPEQADNKPVDEGADWWAFGLMLYETLSGRRAFMGETSEQLKAAILTAPIDWSALPHATPRPLRQLLRRCLERDPHARLRDAAAARRLLEQAAPAQAGALVKQLLQRPAYRWGAFATALLLVAAAVAGVRMWPGRASEPSKPASMTVIYEQEEGAGEVCDADRRSAVIARQLSSRLKENPRLALNSSERTLEGLLTAVGLTELAPALDVDWVVRVQTKCAPTGFAIAYEIADRSGKLLARGDRQDVEALSGAVLTSIGVAPSQVQVVSENERKYRAALDLMTQFGNRRALDDAVGLLEALRRDNPLAPRVNAALAKAYYLAYNLGRSQSPATNTALQPEITTGAMRKRLRDLCEIGAPAGQSALSEEAVEARINCGYVFARFGDHEAAIYDLTAIRAAAINNPEFHLTLAECYEYLAGTRAIQGNSAEAEAALAQAEKEYLEALALRRDWGTRIELGRFYFQRTAYEKAAEQFQAAVSLLPSEPLGTSNLAMSYLYLGRFDEALALARKGVVENDPDTLFDYGAALFFAGRCAEAAEVYAQALGQKSERPALTAATTQEAAELPTDLRAELLAGRADACRCARGDECQTERDYVQAVALLRPTYSAPHELDATELACRISFVAEWLAKAGRKREALAELRRLRESPQMQAACAGDCLVNSIKALYFADERDQLSVLLRRALTHSEQRKVRFSLQHDPELAVLRADLQYQRLIATSFQ